jgi:hypothetical protein
MALDPSISLDVAGGGGQSAPSLAPANPFGSIGPAMQFQQGLNSLRQFQAQWGARQRLGQIVAGAPDLETGLQAATQDPQVAAFGGEAIGALRSMQQTMVQTQGLQANQARDAYSAAVKGSAAAMVDPTQFEPALMTQLRGLPKEIQQRALPMFKSFQAAMEDGLPADKSTWTSAQKAQFQTRLMGTLAGQGSLDPVYQAMGWLPRQVQTLPTPSGAQQPTVIGGPELGMPGAPSGQSPGGSAAPNGLGATMPPPTGPGLPAPLPGPAPAPPSPGRVLATGPSTTQSKYLESRGTDMAQYQQDLDARVADQGQIMKTLSAVSMLGWGRLLRHWGLGLIW